MGLLSISYILIHLKITLMGGPPGKFGVGFFLVTTFPEFWNRVNRVVSIPDLLGNILALRLLMIINGQNR
jgi:hypothetical protein